MPFHLRPERLSPRSKTILGLALASLWAVLMIWAFWWYEARLIRPFSDVPLDSQRLPLELPPALAGSGAIRLVHFFDANCPCQANSLRHLEALVERFKDRGVDFYLYSSNPTQLPNLEGVSLLIQLSGAELMPASPATAIWSQDGQLSYFGPYSADALCSIDNSVVEPILESLIQGREVLINNSLSVGCFCAWPSTQATH